MARSLYGNCIGRAAHTERLEQWQDIRDQDRAHRRAFTRKWKIALTTLKHLDPDGWEKWYDERPEQTAGQMYPPILKRIRELKKAKSWAY